MLCLACRHSRCAGTKLSRVCIWSLSGGSEHSLDVPGRLEIRHRLLTGRWRAPIAIMWLPLFLLFWLVLFAFRIGLLVGINMVFGGTALIAMALHARNAA